MMWWIFYWVLLLMFLMAMAAQHNKSVLDIIGIVLFTILYLLIESKLS